MDDVRKQYEKTTLEIEELIRKMNSLKENEMVKRYFDLFIKENELAHQQRNLYRQLKTEDYESCNHIWVNIGRSSEGLRRPNCSGCIKCGLDESIYQLIGPYRDLDCLTFKQQIMYDFMKRGGYKRKGIHTDVLCDFDLAKAIYSRIKETYPDIDDETAKKYFEIALADIREIKINDERKVSRAKRLSLSPKFNKWNVETH